MKSFSHEGIESTFGRLQKADEEFRSVSARSHERIRSAPCAKFTRRHKTDDVCIRVQTERIHSHYCPLARRCVCTKRGNSNPTTSSCDHRCVIKLIEGNFPLLQTRERQVMFVAASHLSVLTRYSKFSTDVMPSSCIFHSICPLIFSFLSLCIRRGCACQVIKSD